MSDLKTWRKAKKVSQERLSQRLGISQSHLSQIENGTDRISLEVCAKIFAETGVRVGHLKDATAQQARAVVGLTKSASAA